MFTEFAHVLALNIALASLGLGAAALGAARLIARSSLPLQHGLLLAALILALACPLPLWIAHRQGVALFSISFASMAMKPQLHDSLPYVVPQQPNESASPTTRESRSTPTRVTTAQSGTGGAQTIHPGPQKLGVAPSVDAPSSHQDFIEKSIQTDGARQRIPLALSWQPGLSDLILLAWLSVSGLLAVRTAHGLLSIRFLRRSICSATTTRPLWASEEESISAKANWPVSFTESRLVSSPLILGFFRPMIVVPQRMVMVLSNEEMACVLAHERAHIARRDTVVALLQSLATIAYWWNPAVMLVNRKLCSLREQICDDYVVERFGTGHVLAEAMVKIAELAVDQRARPSLALRFFSQRRELEQRICRLLQSPRPRAVRLGKLAWVVVGAFSAACASFCIPLVQAQVAPSESPRSALKAPGEGRISLAGVVQDHNGVPVPMADVWLITYENNKPIQYLTVSDAHGEFRFEDIKASSLTLAAKTAQRSFAAKQMFNIQPGRLVKNQVLVLAPPRELKVTVKDQEDQPVAGAEMTAIKWRTKQSNWCWLPEAIFQKEEIKPKPSNENGQIVFKNLPWDAECIVQIAHTDFALEESQPIPIDAPAAQVVLERGSPLHFKVLDDETGEPVPDTSILVSGIVNVVRRKVPVDADGKVTVRLGDSQEVSIHAEHPLLVSPKRVHLRSWVSPTDHRIEFRMKRKGVVRGRVVDTDTGQPVSGVSVGVITERSQYFTTTTTDANGMYEMNAPVGYVEMSVLSNNGYYAERNQLTSAVVIAGEVATAKKDLLVRKLPDIEGRVTYGGKPCKNALVVIGSAYGEPVLTNDQGQFRLQLLHDDPSMFVEASSLSEKLSGAEGYTLEDAQADKELVIELQPESELVGQVTGPAGESIAGSNVYLTSVAKHNTWSTVSTVDASPVDSSGRYRFWGLSRAREYRIAAQRDPMSRNVGPWIAPDKSVVDMPPLKFSEPPQASEATPARRTPSELRCSAWLNTEPLKLDALRGKIVLLEFWGTWCGPCVAELPYLQLLHEAFHDKGLVIIGVHDNSGEPEQVQEFLKQRGINYPIAIDDANGQTCSAYDVQAFPTTVLIDRQGNIIDAPPQRGARMLSKVRRLALYGNP